ncbi:3D domain-containing protein [Paenibacillus beijingensis]|uniref:LysM domain-containing protein n=1 Tax=Paenibacillus beijingensis TaxID=1126833 RepID=A0A0D5NLD0_9BACL|nr:3D domain-containing protein [Paenibacillus beijingensis]AJY75723.1 hypothetical protein VN24_15650 [Paenibacillus beijingensis]
MMKRTWKQKAAAALLGIALFTAASPVLAASQYTADDDDTFWLLSRKFGVPLDKLMEANADVDPGNIYKGLTLTIPSGTVKAAAKPAGGLLKAASEGEGGAVISANGVSYEVAKSFQVKATAYTSAPEENGKWGPVDYFGNPLKVGTVAVDPNVIPLGTKLYITGYDFGGLPSGGMIATASDMGGAIKGKRIDIFVPGTSSEASTFGFQYVNVQLLK